MRRKILKVFSGLFLFMVFLLIGGWLAFVPWSKEPGYAFVMAWGEPGSGPGQFDDPTGIAVSGADPLYLSLNAFIEEGFDVGQLERIVADLGRAAAEIGV